MSKHLFRLLFGAFFLVAATAFTGCSDDDDKSLTPKLTADPTALDFTDETATTQTVAITANCEWTVTASNLDWATISPMSGKGNGTISVTVSELPAGTNLREGKISFTLIHPEFGKWGQAESSVAVKQYGSGVTPPPTGDAIYANDFDKEQATKTYGSKGESWPYLDQFNGWENHSGTGADVVTYSYNGMSARANSTSNSDYSDYEGSGANNLFFGASAVFTIEKISIGARNLKLSFGAERYSQTAGSDFIHDDFRVQLSNDGSAWSSPIIYSFAKGVDPSGRWDLATADFTLPENTTTLYIRFTSNVDSAHRLDDVTLAEGVGGQQISFDGDTPTPGETVTTTIPELIALCEAAGSTQKVINETKDYCFEAVVVTDKEGGNTTTNNLQLMTEGATTAKNGITLFGSGVYTNPADDAFVFKAGDKVKVTLKAGLARVTTYSSLYEVTGSASEEWCVVEKIGETTIVPVEITPEQIIEFQAMPVTIKNVTAPAAATWNGTKTFTVGGTNLIVYTQSGAPWAEQTFVGGATGSITGYAALYKGAAQLAPRNVADIADFMGEPSTDPAITKLDPTSLSFAATDNAKTVTVTAANADDCTIEAATDKSEQFTTSVDGMVVTVTPKENTTEQAITATLTIKLMKAGAAVDTKTVAISQAGKSGSGGDGQQITLTLDDIIAIGGKSGTYAEFTYTNTFGEWSGKAAGGSSGKECLQINVKDNSAFGSFVQIPAVDGTIEKIEVTIREPYKGRAIGIFPVGYTYTKDTLAKMKEQLAKDAIAISNETPSDVNNNEPFTFVIDNLSAKNLTQFSIFPTLGAVSITAITVTYSK